MTQKPIQHFLISYNIASGEAHVRPFGEDYAEALQAYTDAEEAHKEDSNLDIVLVGAESLDVIRRTHSSYFETHDEIESMLAGILTSASS